MAPKFLQDLFKEVEQSMRDGGDSFTDNEGEEIATWKAQIVYDNPVLNDEALVNLARAKNMLDYILELSQDRDIGSAICAVSREEGADYTISLLAESKLFYDV